MQTLCGFSLSAILLAQKKGGAAQFYFFLHPDTRTIDCD